MLAELTEISLTGIALWLVSLMQIGALAFIGFSFKRLVSKNDEAHEAICEKINKTVADHAVEKRELAGLVAKTVADQAQESRDLDARIDKLLEAIAAEREARHASHKSVDDRVWALNGELKESYQPRREGMRLYGSLAQKMDRQHTELMDKIEALPCVRPQPACPGVHK
jgi:hypothetical protein